MKKILFLLSPLVWVLAGCPAITEQVTDEGRYASQGWVPEDRSYSPNIRTAQLYRPPFEASYPILYLGQTQQLTLEFDEIIPEDQRETDFFIDFISCDINWRPTNIVPLEFYEGFSQQRIEDFQRSTFTKVPYVHYRHSFPAEGQGFKQSGNYLLKVYRNGNPRDVVLTRRFIVVETKVPIVSKYELNARVERMRMQEFAFDLMTGGLNIFNPALDLQVRVLQNFRWDNAYSPPQPRFVGENQFEYRIELNQAFNGGNEFRQHQVFSTRFYAESIQEVEEGENQWEVFLFPDPVLASNEFRSIGDRNGTFSVQVQEWPDADINADYVNNHFTLKAKGPSADPVYIFGGLSNWQVLPDFRMEYDQGLQAYTGSVLLKQGIYDYSYVVARPDGSLDETAIEGDHIDTENFYNILVYYRGPADRTDRIWGYMPLNYQE
ncbi:MAG: type IX secretion system plug protein domain-containing protein [Bacteroidota bacterium]